MKRNIKRITGLFVWMLPAALTFASAPNNSIDVVHYAFRLEVNDSTDVISGVATIDLRFVRDVAEFELDLTSSDTGKDGMEVQEVLFGSKSLKFNHQSDRLRITLDSSAKSGQYSSYQISYRGVPRDGLIIGRNKFGDRGFFGDNWPDRGHHWLPVVDHPSDKASVDFSVIAPQHYSVVANGLRIEESPIDSKRTLTRWHEEVPLPVKVMVVGIARFAVQYAGSVDDIRVESWVYPQNREAGFVDYAVAVKVLDFFHHHIGPYSFKKLANVQSKTRWGGLENANTIFYYENSVTGRKEAESLIAHEEAHQWFGNSVTEKSWHHVWLSEGFATYFCNLYLESAYGRDRLVEKEKEERKQVIAYCSKNAGPIVDTTIRDINTILNINTYQKAGWVLHMLRHQLGDDIFWKGIQQYYVTFQNQNALTADFQRAMEQASGKDLSIFFKQWLWSGGHPKLAGTWRYDAKTKSVTLEVDQIQTVNAFVTPLDIGLLSENAPLIIKTVDLSSKSQKFTFSVAEKPKGLVLDPQTWLLFEGQLTQR